MKEKVYGKKANWAWKADAERRKFFRKQTLTALGNMIKETREQLKKETNPNKKAQLQDRITEMLKYMREKRK